MKTCSTTPRREPNIDITEKTMSSTQIRNIAIIAHVDHGKTTLVDQLLRQSGTFAAHEKVVDTVMDNNAIEKERGITILAKNCAVSWKGTHINIVDTPGHAGFWRRGGTPCPWSTACAVADRRARRSHAPDPLRDQEGPGPGPETHRRGEQGRQARRQPDKVINAAFDLFDKLGANDEQLDFPVVYASGINGWSSLEEGRCR